MARVSTIGLILMIHQTGITKATSQLCLWETVSLSLLSMPSPDLRIAIFYHCLFALGDPPELLPNAFAIVRDQMQALEQSELLENCGYFLAGVNGGEESAEYARDRKSTRLNSSHQKISYAVFCL